MVPLPATAKKQKPISLLLQRGQTGILLDISDAAKKIKIIKYRVSK